MRDFEREKHEAARTGRFIKIYTFLRKRELVRPLSLKTRALKVPKHEIFDSVFFTSKEPIWSPDT